MIFPGLISFFSADKVNIMQGKKNQQEEKCIENVAARSAKTISLGLKHKPGEIQSWELGRLNILRNLGPAQ